MTKVNHLAHNIKFLRIYTDSTQKQFGEELNVSEDQIGTFERRGTRPDVIVMEKLSALSGLTVEQLESIKLDSSTYEQLLNPHIEIKKKKTEVDKRVEQEESADHLSVVEESQADFSISQESMSGQAIIKLANSNVILTEANRTLADAHKILAKNNEKLISLLKPIGRGDQEIPEVVASRFSDLLELLAQIGSGKKWKSVQEARAELSKLILVPGSNG